MILNSVNGVANNIGSVVFPLLKWCLSRVQHPPIAMMENSLSKYSQPRSELFFREGGGGY